MPKFNPSEKRSSAEVPAGVHMLALVWVLHKQGRGGADYLSAKFRVIDGPAKGSEMFTMLGLDFSRAATQVSWSIMAEVVGLDHEVELGSISEGTEDEGARNLGKWFVGRVYKAEVTLQQSGQYVNRYLRFKPTREWNRQEMGNAKAFEDAWRANAGDFDDPPDEPAAQASTYQAESYDGGGFTSDDDIPF